MSPKQDCSVLMKKKEDEELKSLQSKPKVSCGANKCSGNKENVWIRLNSSSVNKPSSKDLIE